MATKRTSSSPSSGETKKLCLKSLNLVLIKDLHPSMRNVHIQIRILSKSQIRTWEKRGSQGQLFNCYVFDAELNAINITLFNTEVDKFFERIEVDHVYYISNFIVKTANQSYLLSNTIYEINFNDSTIVENCDEEFPVMSYNFVPLLQVYEKTINTLVDIIAVVHETQQLSEFTNKTSNNVFYKRNIVLMDKSSACIDFTLWGKDAQTFDDKSHPIIVIKNAKIDEYRGQKSISISSIGNMKLNFDCPGTNDLRLWYDKIYNLEEICEISSNVSTNHDVQNITEDTNTEELKFKEN